MKLKHAMFAVSAFFACLAFSLGAYGESSQEDQRFVDVDRRMRNVDQGLELKFADIDYRWVAVTNRQENILSALNVRIVRVVRGFVSTVIGRDDSSSQDLSLAEDRLSPRERKFFALIVKHSQETGMPLPLAMALIKVESAYRADALGPVVHTKGKDGVRRPTRAVGLTQLLPSTGRAYGVNVHDPEGNIRGGLTYFMEQFSRFQDKELALAAYNAGPSRVVDGKVPKIPATKKYIRDVLENESYYAEVLGMVST